MSSSIEYRIHPVNENDEPAARCVAFACSLNLAVRVAFGEGYTSFDVVEVADSDNGYSTQTVRRVRPQ